MRMTRRSNLKKSSWPKNERRQRCSGRGWRRWGKAMEFLHNRLQFKYKHPAKEDEGVARLLPKNDWHSKRSTKSTRRSMGNSIPRSVVVAKAATRAMCRNVSSEMKGMNGVAILDRWCDISMIESCAERKNWRIFHIVCRERPLMREKPWKGWRNWSQNGCPVNFFDWATDTILCVLPSRKILQD